MDVMDQRQRAGDNSQQYQISSVVINQGITEERARAVFSEMIPQALEEYTKEAYTKANDRISKLENRLMPRIVDIDGALAAFADPAFQILLRKAQQSAAATERDEDYSLLSELLICHIQKGSNRKNRTGIKKAIEVVDEIDNDALCGLTLAHAVNAYRPVTGDMHKGLEALDKFFTKLMYMEPPVGSTWTDQLDVLNAIRILQISHFKSISEICTTSIPGYICIGINKDAENFQKACDLLNNIHLSSDILVSNELLDGYVKLPICSKETISELFIINANGKERKINQQEIDILEKIWDLYDHNDTLQKKVNDNFIETWDEFDALRKLKEWWEKLSVCFSITVVGTVLAHTNAKRCDPTLPDLI